MSSTFLRAGAGVFLSLSAAALGQTWPCVEGWQGLALPGGAGQLGTYSVNDLKWWDPDGPGPRAPIVLVAGSFPAAGDLVGGPLVAYDPPTRSWLHVATPLSGSVREVLPLGDGHLAAVGSFTFPGRTSPSRFATWDGTSWHDDSDGIAEPVYSIARLHSGEFVIGTSSQILRRTASGWEPMHGEEIFGTATVLRVAPDGRLFAGGTLRLNFTSIGVLMWDGTAWSLACSSGGSFTQPGGVGIIEVLPDGCMLFSGAVIEGVRSGLGIMKWCNGSLTSLSSVPYPYGTIGAHATSVIVNPDGSLFVEAAYEFSPRVYFTEMLELDVSGEWHIVNAPPFGAQKMLRVGPDRILHNTNSHTGLLERFQFQPLPLSNSLNAPAISLAALPDNGAIVGGDFTYAGPAAATRVAKLVGNSWQAFDEGLDVAPRCALQLPDGSIAVGGNFSGFYDAGLVVPSPRVARWTGTQWQPMGINGVGRVRALFLDAQQRLHAVADSSNAGISPLQRRDGDTWTPVPVPAGFTEFRAVVDEPDGSKVLGCNNGVLFRWNGSGLAQLASPRFVVGLNALLRLPSGDLIIGGANSSNPTAVLTRFNRQAGTWSFLGSPLNGSITSLAPLPRPDGGADVLVGGEFTIAGNATSRYIARWVPETNQWFSVGTGANAPVRTIASLPSGEILVAGDFTVFDGKAAAYISMYRIPCPADFTCDTLVDGDDVIEFFRAWDTNDLRANFDNDGATSSADVVAFLQTWDTGC